MTLSASSWRTPALVLAAGAVVLAISLGVRHAFGVFLQPMSLANGWGRETFAFAIALQNLLWGLTQPFTGMLADRFGAGKVVLAGALLYAAGLVLMAYAATPAELALSAGVLIGLGLSGTSFAIVFGAVSRAVAPERRSLAMGIASAVGSFGQFVMLPGSLALISWLSWPMALVALAVLCALLAPLSLVLNERRAAAAAPTSAGEHSSAREAIAAALRHRGFWLLSLGFFVCGFQVVFIATHLPAYLTDKMLPLSVGSTVLALIGLFNIAGTYSAGLLGERYRKPALLAAIYSARAVAIALFVILPLTPVTAYAFGIVMGLLWLSTVPLTNATVATMFGVKHLSMLGGVVFLFHQIGAFLGGWLGGYLYDRSGSYDAVWLIAIALSVLAALLNMPIREEPATRAQPAPQPA